MTFIELMNLCLLQIFVVGATFEFSNVYIVFLHVRDCGYVFYFCKNLGGAWILMCSCTKSRCKPPRVMRRPPIAFVTLREELTETSMPVNHSMNNTVMDSVNQSVELSVQHSVDHSVNPSVRRFVNHSVNHSADFPINQSSLYSFNH